jgi:hypothetical protein
MYVGEKTVARKRGKEEMGHHGKNRYGRFEDSGFGQKLEIFFFYRRRSRRSLALESGPEECRIF